VNFIKKINSTPKEISADLEMLGQWARSDRSRVSLKASTASRSLELARLRPHTAIKVQAAVGSAYRVLLPDGLIGYVPSRHIESIASSLETRQADLSHEVVAAPTALSEVVEKIDGGEEFKVLGHFDGYSLVKTQKEKLGWLLIPSEPGSSK
jgi:hypothetical protein